MSGLSNLAAPRGLLIGGVAAVGPSRLSTKPVELFLSGAENPTRRFAVAGLKAQLEWMMTIKLTRTDKKDQNSKERWASANVDVGLKDPQNKLGIR